MRKKTDKEFKQEVYDLVGNEYTVIGSYKGSTTKVNIRHNKCNYVNHVFPNYFLKHPSCKKCSGKIRYTTNSYRERVGNNTNGEYTFIGPYKNNKTIATFKHNKCNNKFPMTPNAFNNGNRCPICSRKKSARERSKDTEWFKEQVKVKSGNDYTVLGEYKNNYTPIKMRHNVCNYEWSPTPTSFLQSKNGCPKCFNEKVRGKFRRKTDKEFKQEVEELTNDEFEFLDPYQGDKLKITCRHKKCGYEWPIKPNAFLNQPSCPKCNETIGEREIRNYLDKHNINYQYAYHLDNKQHLDFYLSEYRIGIEYQGEQHYKPVDFAGKGEEWAKEQFENNQARDKKKLDYCNAQGIEIIYIPYYSKADRVLDKQLLSKLTIPMDKLKKHYQKLDVFQATMQRLDYLFKHFKNVCIAFSGGKDSGIILNLALMYAKEHKLLSHLSVYNMDYEAQYNATTDYIDQVFKSLPKEVHKYWLCLPLQAQCAVNMNQYYWIPWEKSKKDIWVRQMPKYDYVINEDNCEFDYHDWDYTVQDNFSNWLAKKYNGSLCMIVGIRSVESLSRQATITSDNKVNQYQNQNYILNKDNFSVAYPIYDWETKDVWIANYKFGFKYNKIYDLFYQAGVSIDDMRVASPFNEYAKSSLHLYRVLDPQMWGKMVSRVNGVGFTGRYGNTSMMGWKSITKPSGFTWKEYYEFLMGTLPDNIRKHFAKKVEASKRSWRIGGARDKKTIDELEAEGAPVIRTHKMSNRGKRDKEIIKFADYLDDTNVTEWKKIPTYKRACVCILKNDWQGVYMGFSRNKEEQLKRKKAMENYQDIKDR